MFDYFLTYDFNNDYIPFVSSFSVDIKRYITTFSECHSVFFVVVQKSVS